MSKEKDPYKKLRNQITAARGLLDMSQNDLGKAIGIDAQSISRVERGLNKSQGSILKVVEGLRGLGVRFNRNGVELIENTITILEGEGCYLELLDHVVATCSSLSDPELLIMYASDAASPKEVNDKYRFMRKAGIKMRQLIREGDTYIMGDFSEYREISAQYFVNIVTLVYGNYVAQVSGDENRVVIYEDRALAKRERSIFAYFWDHGAQPTQTTAKELFDE